MISSKRVLPPSWDYLQQLTFVKPAERLFFIHRSTHRRKPLISARLLCPLIVTAIAVFIKGSLRAGLRSFLRLSVQPAYYKEVMKPLSENRRATFDYEILERIEAGIELFGHEVKSVKAGRGNLAGTYAIIRGGEIFLINCQIPPYQQGNVPDDYDPSRTRRLLLHKTEIRELTGKLKERGLSLLALSFTTKKNLVKVELGLGRSRKAHDKREVLKKRAVQREIDRGE